MPKMKMPKMSRKPKMSNMPKMKMSKMSRKPKMSKMKMSKMPYKWEKGDKVRPKGCPYWYTIRGDDVSDPRNWLMSAQREDAGHGSLEDEEADFCETIPRCVEEGGWWEKYTRRSARLSRAALRNKRKRNKSNHKKRSRVVKKTKKRRR